MIRIPFTKAHGAMNDFLLSWKDEVPEVDYRAAAMAICHRHTGVGADGWMLVERLAEGPAQARIQLFNSDGSDSEISGNGTRCAAALVVEAGLAASDVQLETGAGIKHLRVVERFEDRIIFEMNMGAPMIEPANIDTTIDALGETFSCTILNVGNPQCAVFVDSFDFDWARVGAELERHERFPQRSNISFVKRINPHTIEVRFFERGAGVTMSSGTGSTGAAMAAIARGLVASPVHVRTSAGLLPIRIVEGSAYLTGPAALLASGTFQFTNR